MRLKKTKTHYVLMFTPKEFDAMWAAVESIGSNAAGGAYADVTRLLDNLSICLNKIENRKSNIWVIPGMSAIKAQKTQDT